MLIYFNKLKYLYIPVKMLIKWSNSNNKANYNTNNNSFGQLIMQKDVDSLLGFF